ncbi:hypothetical protein TWF281_010181 [Arthrobotrys megalospora]
MTSNLIYQTIFIRYLPSKKWLEDQLRTKFPGHSPQVTEPQQAVGERWVVKVPSELQPILPPRSSLLSWARVAEIALEMCHHGYIDTNSARAPRAN